MKNFAASNTSGRRRFAFGLGWPVIAAIGILAGGWLAYRNYVSPVSERATEGKLHERGVGDSVGAVRPRAQQPAVGTGTELERLSHLALGYEQQEKLSAALQEYQRRLELDQHNPAARLDVARVLRKLGQLSEAEKTYPTPNTFRVSRDVALEIAERRYAQGDYAAAVEWFSSADLKGAHLAETLRTAASAWALSGEPVEAQQIFARVDAAQANSRHSSELLRRLKIDPGDIKAKIDLQQLSAEDQFSEPSSLAVPLYEAQCATCHGSTGEADGRAARFCFPRPRNFQSQSLRLVGTINSIADATDIAHTIRNGIPGTAMPAYPELSEQEIDQLTKIVLQFRVRGVRRRLTDVEDPQERARVNTPNEAAQIERQISLLTTPAARLTIPKMVTSAAAVERGARAFTRFGCSHCHRSQSEHRSEMELTDDHQQVCLPRDLAVDAMKGGSELSAIFQRIRLGMPGTPHPSLDAPDEQIAELAIYCQSLAQEPQRQETNQEREHRAATTPWSAL